MKLRSRILPLLAALAFLAAAGRADADSGAVPLAPGSDPDTGISSVPNLPLPLTSIVGDDYRLQPSDLVIIELYHEPDASTQQRISNEGEVRLPMLGTVRLAGLSVRTAEDRLEDLYRDQGYYLHPQVILYVAQHAARTISVLGQVNRPDRIELPTGTETMGLAQAVAQTGGLTRIAKANAVEISRVGPDGQTHRIVVNLDAYLYAKKSDSVPDFPLQPNDIVFVPERVL